jgi:hypothetical protein
MLLRVNNKSAQRCRSGSIHEHLDGRKRSFQALSATVNGIPDHVNFLGLWVLAGTRIMANRLVHSSTTEPSSLSRIRLFLVSPYAAAFDEAAAKASLLTEMNCLKVCGA